MNIIESVSGGIISLSESAVGSQIVWPLTNWLASFLNFVFRFFPVFMLLAFFGLCYWLFLWLFKSKKDKNNKSLENK